MVVVTNKPYSETEPMLDNPASSGDNNPPYFPENAEELRRGSIGEAYKNIASSMNAEQLDIKDVNLACQLLDTAIKLKNIPLARQCINNMDNMLNNIQNVIVIYSHLSKCKMPSTNLNDFEPSAPPIVEDENQRDKDWVQEFTENLRYNCLLEIDKYAEIVLKQKEILDLSYLDFLAIVSRDTLQISDELLVYSAVVKWSTKECQRRTLQTHQVNIKAVVRDLRYAPRYGLLTKKQFTCRTIHGVKGPTRSDILDEQEWRRILFYIKEKSKGRPVEPLHSKMSQPRIQGYMQPRNFGNQNKRDECIIEIINKDNRRCSTGSGCDKFLMYFLACCSAVFD